MSVMEWKVVSAYSILGGSGEGQVNGDICTDQRIPLACHLHVMEWPNKSTAIISYIWLVGYIRPQCPLWSIALR